MFLPLGFNSVHDLSIYTTSYPFTFDDFSTYQGKSAAIGIIPQSNINGDVPANRLTIWSSTAWDKYAVYFEPDAVNTNYGKEVLGADYTRAGMSARINSSFVRYHSDNLAVQFGRAPVWWGQSWGNSIIQSRNGISYDHLSTKLQMGDFQLEILSGQLNSESLWSNSIDGSIRIKRFIGGHRLIWIPREKWMLSVGEQIIYSGENRSIELFYLNPAIPYFFTALEDNEAENPDNDNSIVFLTGRYAFRHDLSTYFEFIIDDYQVDNNDVPNTLGFQLGIDGAYFGASGKKLIYTLEYTAIDSWTYIHHGQYTSWQNLGHPIGYKYGPDCRSFESSIDYWVNKKYRCNLRYTYLEKGANNLNTTWDSPGTRGDPFPSSPVTRHPLLVTSFTRFWKYGNIEIGYSNYPITDAEIDGVIDAPDGSLFIKAQLTWGFGYNLISDR